MLYNDDTNDNRKMFRVTAAVVLSVGRVEVVRGRNKGRNNAQNARVVAAKERSVVVVRVDVDMEVRDGTRVLTNQY